MTDIKRPKWDKPTERIASGGYGPDTIINNIAIGMTAKAKHETVDVTIKITKVENKCDAEGTIIKIDSKAESIGTLSVGDHVFITRWDIEHLK